MVEYFWTGHVAQQELYYVRVFNNSPFGLDYILEAKEEQPAVSGAMVQDKVDDIRRTGASVFLAGDCGCLMNISGAMAHDGVAVEGKHLAEFLWERIHAS
jgi:Fe-S oxidoreductase